MLSAYYGAGLMAVHPIDKEGVVRPRQQRVKAKWGHETIFWGGGIDAQHVLPFATPREVRQAVRENVVALYEAAYEFGFYER